MLSQDNAVTDNKSPSSSVGREPISNAAADADLQKLVEGDADAFWRLWKQHEQHLYRICLSQFYGVHEEAEDALSILIIKLVDLLPRHAEQIRNLRAWLTRITYNLCIDIRREIKRSRTFASLDDLTAVEDAVLCSAAETPEDTALRVEGQQVMYSAIESLSANLRTPFLLHHVYGWPYQEIAVRLAISPENARKRSQLGRAALQQMLEDYLNGAVRPSTAAAQRDLDSYLQPLVTKTRHSPSGSVRLVNVALNSNLEKSFCVHLDYEPGSLFPKIEQAMRYNMSHPRGWKKRLELAHLFYATGDWTHAAEEYERILEKQPRLFKVYLELGNLFNLMGRRAESVGIYQRGLQFITAAASRHHLRGMIALRQRDHETAINEFHEAINIEPDAVTHWTGLAMVHVLRDSPLEALVSWRESLRVEPSNANALTCLPDVLRNLGQMQASLRCSQQALEHQAANVPLITLLADHRSQQRIKGKKGESIRKLIDEAFRLAPDAPEAHHSLSFFHLCRGEWREGVRVARMFAERHQNSPEAWRGYAKAAFRTGNFDTAGKAIEYAYALDPNSWRTNLALCEIFSWHSPTPDLRELFRLMLEKFPERWTIWSKVALALISVFGDAEHACAISAEGPRLQPQLWSAWFGHARVLALAQKYKEAIAAAEIGWRWLVADEDGIFSVPAAVNLAQNHLFLNSGESAKTWMQEAAARLPSLITLDPAKGNYWQAKLGELRGDRAEALRAYRASVANHIFFTKRQEVEAAIARLTSSPKTFRPHSFPIQ